MSHDHFLTHLLSNQSIRQIYPFTTHGLPDGLSTGPLPSFLNVLAPSQHSFRLGFLPFQRRHKGCSLLAFDHIGTHDEQGHALPIILAATHLCQGLTDGAVVAKCGDINTLSITWVAHIPATSGSSPGILPWQRLLTP